MSRDDEMQATHFDRGQAWMERGRPERAEEALRQALSEDPESPDVHSLLGLAMLQLDRPKEALEFAESAAGLAPDWDVPYMLQSRALTDLDRFKAARAAAEQAIELDPEDADNHASLAIANSGLKRWREVLAAAEAGLSLDSEHVSCANLRAFALIQLGEGQDADFALEAALARDPEDSMTHESLGWKALSDKDHEAAIRHYTEALRLDPMSESARQGLVTGLNARNPLYRPVLSFFLFLSRLDKGKVWMFMIATVFLRQALLRIGEKNPELAPFTTAAVVAVGGFLLMTWIADPLFNLALRLSPEGRLALTDAQRFQTNCLLSCLAITFGLGALWLSGFYGMGLAAAMMGALTLPVVIACGREGSARLRVAAFAGVMLLSGTYAVYTDIEAGRERAEIADYMRRLPPEMRQLGDREAKIDEPESMSADELAGVGLGTEELERLAELNGRSEELIATWKRHDNAMSVFLIAFVAFTWIG